MININLLPPEIKAKIKQKKHVANIFSICLMIVFIVIVLSILLGATKTSLLKTQLDKIQNEITQVNTSSSSFSKAEDKALFLNDRAQIAEKIEKKQPRWSQILQDLINSVPTDVQFTSLTADLSKTPNFVLLGNTVNEREIIKFKDKLEASSSFKDVAFKSASINNGQAADPNQVNKLNFSLEFNLKENK